MRSRMQDCRYRDGFTLIELLLVLAIVIIVSAVALPTVLPALAHRQVSEAGRILQGTLIGARDDAIHAGRPSGIRLLPDPAWPLKWDAKTGQLITGQVLAYNRVVPIGPAPEYQEGRVSVFPSTAYAIGVTGGKPCLVLEEAPRDRHGAPNPPTSWMWNVRVGDAIQLNNAGPWYTVIGPMQVGPAAGNTEAYTNVGPPGSKSPLGLDYLLLTNGRDDNGDGWVDEGWDGVDNNGDGLVDEHMPGVIVTVPGQPNCTPPDPAHPVVRDEWEVEAWLGAAASGMTSQPYTIRRRPMPSPSAREVALPTRMVIDAGRSRLPVNVYTGAVELMINPDGTASPSLPYGPPASLGMGASWSHFALVDRADVGVKAVKEGWSILSLNLRSGSITVTDEPDPANPFAYALRGGK